MNDDDNKPKSAADQAAAEDFRAMQLAYSTCLSEAALLMGGNPARAALALAAAAEALHCEAVRRYHSDPEALRAYDQLHAYIRANAQRASAIMLSALGIDYKPATAELTADTMPPIDPRLVN